MPVARTSAEERGGMEERGRGGGWQSMAGRQRQQLLVLEEAREEGNPN
jgi:hypothetical protein